MYEHPLTREIQPSITSVIGMLDKSALRYWVANQCAEYVKDNIDELRLQTQDTIFQRVKAAPWLTSGSAANVGDIVHNAIEAFINGYMVEPASDWPITAKRMWRSFLTFDHVYKPEWLGTEFTVWSSTHGYAGTADWAARIRGMLVLGDTKTGKAVYPEVGLQLSAIKHADFILTTSGQELPIPEYERCAALHIRPTSVTLHPIDYIDECFEAFKACIALKRWKDSVSEHVVVPSMKLANAF